MATAFVFELETPSSLMRFLWHSALRSECKSRTPFWFSPCLKMGRWPPPCLQHASDIFVLLNTPVLVPFDHYFPGLLNCLEYSTERTKLQKALRCCSCFQKDLWHGQVWFDHPVSWYNLRWWSFIPQNTARCYKSGFDVVLTFVCLGRAQRTYQRVSLDLDQRLEAVTQPGIQGTV